MADAAKHAREALIEMVAEADETLMEKFFDAGTLTQEELVAGLAQRRRRAAKIFPLVCTSAHGRTSALQPLLDAIVAYVPSPAERPFTAVAKASADVAARRRREGAVRGVRLEDVADPFAGRITMFRVVSGRAARPIRPCTT